MGRTEARGYVKKPAKKLILQESLHGFGFGATADYPLAAWSARPWLSIGTRGSPLIVVLG